MDIRQLRYFVAIVEEGTVSGAAKRLHLSQPPLSQQLKAMEEDVGALLLERIGKRLEVTEAGKRLYEYALQMIELMEAAKSEVQEVGNGLNGRLSIGVNTLSVAGLSPALQHFNRLYPKMTYKIHQGESSHLCRLVREREVELAFVRLPLELGDDLSVLHHEQEPFYVISSDRHTFGDEREISLADVVNLPLLLPSTQGLGVHYLILKSFSELRLEPTIQGECSDIGLLMRLVSAGFCISIVPESLLDHYPGFPIRRRKLSGESGLISSIGLVALRRHRLSKAARNFIDLYRSEK
ncbi:LysR family transcriptional regulator [Cohnella hashimotonis]|uniref:LysR family transcriptional regulator n=1 Tax=Cohnella hashimotonis TaxID=2826895 RepID=A0ABT6TG58_9BACL|nr:LysR family transcriptional regulator [Cohnella hashimotonis]MDI4645828.1 LysR family transcriptional regulator [Cohnella hashimotonis]